MALRALGVVLMVGGVYVVFFRDSAGSITSTAMATEVGSGPAVTTGANLEVAGASGSSGGGDTDPPPPTATVTIAVDPFATTVVTSTTEPLSDDRTEPVAWVTDGCDLSFNGYGVEMKSWGDIRLPYAIGFPTSNPGEAPNCAPKTDFGGAIMAAHLAYLDAVRPDLIPSFAMPGAGLDRRLAEHPGPLDPDALGYVCEPLGWQKHQDGSFLLYHLCGDSGTKVTKVPMTPTGGRWQVEYPAGGEFDSWPAAAGEAYFPFAGGH